MTRFIECKDRRQTLLLPECLDDYVTQDNPLRVIDAFIDELDLQALGFTRAQPAATGRPAYHPAILLKIYRLLGLEEAFRGPPPARTIWQA